jgi:hypothetical protein
MTNIFDGSKNNAIVRERLGPSLPTIQTGIEPTLSKLTFRLHRAQHRDFSPVYLKNVTVGTCALSGLSVGEKVGITDK